MYSKREVPLRLLDLLHRGFKGKQAFPKETAISQANEVVDQPGMPNALRAFLGVIVGLWLLSLAYAEGSWLLSRNWYGFDQIYFRDPAFDYYDYIGRMYLLHRPEFFTSAGYPWYYPAPGALIYTSFYAAGRLTGGWVGGYLIYIAMSLAGVLFASLRLAGVLTQNGLRRSVALRFTLTAAVFSWPIYFALERGNIEAVTWLLLAAGVWAIVRDRWMLAAVVIGVAAAIKFYPGLMFAVFLRPRRWKEIGAGLLAMALTTLAALRFLEPDVALAFRGVQQGVEGWTRDYAAVFDPRYMAYDHSAFHLLKVLTLGSHPAYDILLQRYMLAAAMFCLVLFFGRVIRLPLVNQVMFVTVASVLLPPASFDYTLINLYVPFAWVVLVIVRQWRQGAVMPVLTSVMVLLGLLMGPEVFVRWHSYVGAGLLKAVCLMALLGLAAWQPFGEWEGRQITRNVGRSGGVGSPSAARAS